MNLNRIYHLYDMIKKRLPATYERPKLAFFEDEDSMLENTNTKRDEDDESVYAVVSPETLTISFPMTMKFKYTKKNGEEFIKNVPITKLSDENIAHTILHEWGHLYAGERYGYESKQYSDEAYCDRFASRWIRILIKEKLLQEE